MANRRFIDFPIASTVGDNDIVLIWQDGANKQTTKATILSGLPENLEDLNDVVISGLTNGQILRYDSVTGKWENTDQGNLDLNDLNDVSIVSPSNGQVLVYNSSTSKWENSSGGFVPYTGAVTTVNLGAQTIQAGQFVKAGGTSSQFLKADGSIDSTAYGTGSVTSVGLTMPSAFSVANSPITTAGTLAVTGAGTVGQYIRGDGSLADFPQASGGGSSVSYYLNGSVNQGTIGGVDYKELSKVPILGAGTQFSINANGYIAQFLTDAGDPNLLEIPGGNWNFETYFSASSSGGTPTFYVELYKYDGTTFTLIASSSTSPEFIAFGTNLTPYFSSLAVPTTTLALTDRLAVRYYVNHSGRTITLHTENNTLCQIVTTFTTGLTSLNGLTAQVQNLAVGTSGTDFNIASATATHTFNLPTASATNRGALSSSDWTTFNNKQNALGYVPVPETRTLTINGTAFDLSANRSWIVGDVRTDGSYSNPSWITALAWSKITGTPTTLSGYGITDAVPNSRTITINGTTQDLSANRSFNVGTVTSVGLSSATSGVTIGGSPVTGVGAFTLTIATASGSQQGLLSAADWTTFNNKQNALTNPVTGTGTTNYLAKFTGSTTIGNSQIFDNGTSVGIGTVSPQTVSSGFTLTVGDGATQQQPYLALSRNSLGGFWAGIRWYDGNTIKSVIQEDSDFNLRFSTSNAERLRITSGGNLLVGTTSDNGSRLQVSGGITALNSLVVTSSSNAALIASTNSTTGFSYLDFINSGASGRNYQIGVAGNGASSGYANNLYFDLVGVGNIMTLTSGRNVGIGTSTFVYSPRLAVASVGQNSIAIQTTDVVQGSTGTVLYIGTGASTGNSTYGIIRALGNGGTAATNLVLQESGNVLIGTTTDNGARLQVSGTATFSGSVTAQVNNISADGAGVVLQGYVDNTLRIAVRGSGYNSGARGGLLASTGDFSSSVTATELTLNKGASDTIGAGSYVYYSNVGGTRGAVHQLNASFGLDTFTFDGSTWSRRMTVTNSGNVGIGTSSPNGRLRIQNDNSTIPSLIVRDGGTPTANLIEATSNAYGSSFIVTATGNVGIGTSSPDTFSYGGNRNFLTLRSTATNQEPFLQLIANGSGNSLIDFGNATIRRATIIGFDGSHLAFYTNGSNSGTSVSERMRITSSGNVLIGTTTDVGARLHVNGDVRTEAPTGGSAVNWRLGTVRGGTVTPNATVRVEIGGVLVDLDARYV